MNPPRQHKRYFGLHYILMRILGVGMFHHPEENNFNNYPNKLYILYCFLSFFYLMIYFISMELYFAYKAWVNDLDSQIFFLALTMIGVHTFFSIRLLILIKHNKAIQKIVKTIEIDSKRFKRDEQIIESTILFSKILTYFFLIMGNLTMIFMGVYTLIQDIDRKKKIIKSNYTLVIPRETPFTVNVPWDFNEDGPYIAAYIHCMFGVLWFGNAIMTCDTFVASILAHLSGQFRNVQKLVENIGDNAIELLTHRLNKVQLKEYTQNNIKHIEVVHDNSELREQKSLEAFLTRKKRIMIYFNEEQFNEAIQVCLKEVIQYHQLILDMVNSFQKAYNQGFLCQTLSSFYVIGLILVQVSQNVNQIFSLRLVNSLGFLISILWQLFIQTYTANEVTLQAAKVGDCAFGSCWYAVAYDNGRRKKLLMILIQRTQIPVYLTAGIFAPMSNALFVTVIRRSYQIFTLITTAMSSE